MEWLYDFECSSCSNTFEDMLDNHYVWEMRFATPPKPIIVKCPKCGKDAYILDIKLAAHGHNHSSWSVK